MTLSFALKTIAELFAVLLLLVGIWYEEEIADWEQKVIAKINGSYKEETVKQEVIIKNPAERTYEERKRLAENAAYCRRQAARREVISESKRTKKAQRYVA